MNLEIVECDSQFWEFVRLLRTDNRTSSGFITQTEITTEQQIEYMKTHHDCYRIALSESVPVGYVGVVDGDIRVCVHPEYHRQGVGKFLISFAMTFWPDAEARVKVTNQASQRLFESCGFTTKHIIDNLRIMRK